MQINEEEVKPLIVPESIPKPDENVGGTCVVSMEQLKIRPVCEKLPTACRGKPFKGYNAPGQKRVVHQKENNNEDKKDDEQKAENDVTDIEVSKKLMFKIQILSRMKKINVRLMLKYSLQVVCIMSGWLARGC